MGNRCSLKQTAVRKVLKRNSSLFSLMTPRQCQEILRQIFKPPGLALTADLALDHSSKAASQCLPPTYFSWHRSIARAATQKGAELPGKRHL